MLSNWKAWNANTETWEEWPCNICIPITRNIKFIHTKNVGQSKLDVFLDVDGKFVGLFSQTVNC